MFRGAAQNKVTKVGLEVRPLRRCLLLYYMPAELHPQTGSAGKSVLFIQCSLFCVAKVKSQGKYDLIKKKWKRKSPKIKKLYFCTFN